MGDAVSILDGTLPHCTAMSPILQDFQHSGPCLQDVIRTPSCDKPNHSQTFSEVLMGAVTPLAVAHRPLEAVTLWLMTLVSEAQRSYCGQ